MRATVASAMLTAVLIGGAYVWFSPTAHRQRSIRQIQQEDSIDITGSREQDPVRTFAPQSPLYGLAVRNGPSSIPDQTVDVTTGPIDHNATRADTPSPWQVLIRPEPGLTPSAIRPATQGTGEYHQDRWKLVRNLQRDLTRVGCYDGRVNGQWDAASKQAMTQFTNRLNARLPVGEPDQILLALVQSQTGSVCGTSCPAGQALDEGGRCVPQALLSPVAPDGAQGDAMATPPAAASDTEESSSPTSPHTGSPEDIFTHPLGWP